MRKRERSLHNHFVPNVYTSVVHSFINWLSVIQCIANVPRGWIQFVFWSIRQRTRYVHFSLSIFFHLFSFTFCPPICIHLWENAKIFRFKLFERIFHNWKWEKTSFENIYFIIISFLWNDGNSLTECRNVKTLPTWIIFFLRLH